LKDMPTKINVVPAGAMGSFSPSMLVT